MNPLLGAAVLAIAVYAFLRKDSEADGTKDDNGGDSASSVPTIQGNTDGTQTPLIPASSIPATTIPATQTPPAQPGGAPPNTSGDPVGYNTELYPDAKSVRKGLVFLGELPPANLETPPEPDELRARVKSFQDHYNEASLLGLWQTQGSLIEDGIPGKMTLRALEIAVSGQDGLGLDDTIRGYQWAQQFDL